MLNINEIRSILPHRYPFLLVDRIEKLDPGKNVIGIKNVTINEEFFQGHFPDKPIMPGVLILESMAQVSGFLMKHSVENPQDKLPVIAGVDKARFRRSVIPGDTLVIKSKVLRLRSKIAKVVAKGYVDENIASEAELMFAIQEKRKGAKE